MLGLNPFYHKAIKNLIIAFGAVFNDISIQRFDVNNTVTKTQKVPLAYAPKEKMLARINQDIAGDATEGADVQMVLPRMSFEITGINYDAIRQKSSVGRISFQNSADNTKITQVFEPVPYNVTIDLNILAKYQDDALQVVEQILPFFSPRFNLTVFETSLNIKRDIPIELQGLSYSDNYDGDFNDRRTIIYTLSFSSHVNIYGNVDSTQNIIREVIVNIAEKGTDDSMVPTVGETLTTINVQPNPIGANVDDQFTFTTTITNPERT